MNLRGSIDNQPFDDRNLPPTGRIELILRRWFEEEKERRGNERKEKGSEEKNERNYIRFISTLEEKQQTLRNNRLYDEINYYFNEYET